MSAELQMKRLVPDINPPPSGSEAEDAGDTIWVVVLSDWSGREPRDLVDQVARIFRLPARQPEIPTVLVVDDLLSPAADHEQMLDDLTGAGGIPLVPHPPEDVELIRRDPLAFVKAQLVAMQTQSPATAGVSPPAPNYPDGYKEFAKAVTRLSDQDLREVIEGRLPKDWRYSDQDCIDDPTTPRP